jgi:hypothetical protein
VSVTALGEPCQNRERSGASSEVRAKRREPVGVQGAPTIQEEGEVPRGARRLDPPIRGVFGEVQDLRAVGKERRTSGAEIEAPRIELGERGDQVNGDVALPFRERTDVGKECGIR